MVKYNISEKGKAWKIEREDEVLVGKSVGDKFEGKELMADLEGYELQITGGSDISGFPLSKDAEGIGLKRVLLKRGWGMRTKGEGLRLRKTVRGKSISNKVAQINIAVLKVGKKPLVEIFPEQNNPKEKKAEKKDEPKAEETK
ncbi:MAG: S6e family ribosomal protein [Nanoarchaeota archaeon]